MRRMLMLLLGLIGSSGVLMLLVVLWLDAGRVEMDIGFFPSTHTISSTTAPSSEPLSTSREVRLPCAVNGTPLIAEMLVSYDGPFIEQSSASEYVNLAALLLRNTSPQGVDHVSVTLEQNGKELVFKATHIPPGEAVMVLEYNKNRFSREMLTGCYGEIAWDASGWSIDDVLSFEAVDMGSLWVSNTTESRMEDICLYYKTRYADGLFYLGGITYEIRIRSLEPGERLLLRPEHYAGESSGIVRISYNH